MTFDKDGNVTIAYSGVSITGTWEFGSGKETVTTTFSGTTSTMTILRLTMDELWMKDSDGDKTYYKVN
jgi:hypothetical protein